MSVILSVAIPLDLVATIRNTNDIQEGINTLNSLRKTDVHSSRVVAQLAQAVVTSARSLKYDIKDKTLRPISSPLEDPFSPSVVSPWAPVVWGTKQTAESPVEVVKESINIAVQDDAGGKLFFKMRPYTSIGKLISRYCEAKSVSESELVFSLLFVDLVQKYGRQSSVTQCGLVDGSTVHVAPREYPFKITVLDSMGRAESIQVYGFDHCSKIVYDYAERVGVVGTVLQFTFPDGKTAMSEYCQWGFWGSDEAWADTTTTKEIGLQPGSQIRVVVVPADYDIAITVRDAMGHEERIEILARATFRDLQGIYGDLITPRTVKDLIFCSADLPKIDLEGSAEMSLEALDIVNGTVIHVAAKQKKDDPVSECWGPSPAISRTLSPSIVGGLESPVRRKAEGWASVHRNTKGWEDSSRGGLGW